jgi:hypothetical protein
MITSTKQVCLFWMSLSVRQNTITQFGLASQAGSTGLLAHNYLAGESFFLLRENQKFYLIYGDGQVSGFVVTEILRYKALEPASTSSRFVALENNDTLLASELFSKVYDRDGEVVLQMGALICYCRAHFPLNILLFVTSVVIAHIEHMLFVKFPSENSFLSYISFSDNMRRCLKYLKSHPHGTPLILKRMWECS